MKKLLMYFISGWFIYILFIYIILIDINNINVIDNNVLTMVIIVVSSCLLLWEFELNDLREENEESICSYSN